MDSTKPILRIHYTDFFNGLNANDYIVTSLLRKDYNVVFDHENPDIVIYSSFGWDHIYPKGLIKLFYTSENEYPDFNICDYSASHLRDHVGGKNLWLPVGIRLLSDPRPIPSNPEKRPFASFIASQNWTLGAKYRENFTRYLMENYKRVDCPGRILHNIDIPDLEPRNGQWQSSKLSYIGRYKFNIAFENSNTDGYITEKLTDCFVANTVPIYWGSEGDVAPYPKEAMICANDYPDFESLVARIKEVDENDDLYLSMLRANPMHHKSFVEDQKRRFTDDLYAFLNKIARDAINRRSSQEWLLKRPVGNTRKNVVQYIIEKEENRILDEVAKKTPLDEYKFDKELQKFHDKIEEQKESISKLGHYIQTTLEEQNKELMSLDTLIRKEQTNYNELSLRQKEYKDNLQYSLSMILLPLYKKKLLWTRILSHLLPGYQGGVYIRRKKELRSLIQEIEKQIASNRPF